jgi:hypothetical protein
MVVASTEPSPSQSATCESALCIRTVNLTAGFGASDRGLSTPIGQLLLLIRRLMAAVRASKEGTALSKDGLRGEIPVHQCVFNLRVPKCFVTVGAFEVP